MKWDWELEEEILLVGLYHSLKTTPAEDRIKLIQELSQTLNYRAKINGIETDYKFRNIAGLQMKLQNIEYIATKGRGGLSAVSDLDKKVFLMYEENPDEFNKLVESVKSKYLILNDIPNPSQVIVDDFKVWLTSEAVSEKRIEEIVNSIDYINQYVDSTRKFCNDIFSISTVKDLNYLINIVAGDKYFRFKNKLTYNLYLTSLQVFLKYLKHKKRADIGSYHNNQIGDQNTNSYVSTTEIAKENTSLVVLPGVTDFEKQLLNIISKYFPRGFKLYSIIDTKKLRMHFKENYNFEMNQDDSTIYQILSRICIEYDSGRVMAPDNTINKSELNKILEYISESFKNGKSAMYFEGIYNRFQDMLINTNIYNSKILKQVLKFYVGEKYHFKEDYFLFDEKTEADPTMEIKELLIIKNAPISTQKLKAKLPHIAENVIEKTLSRQEFICVDRDHYTHIDCFNISKEEINTIKNVIQRLINEQGYVLTKGLHLYLKSNTPEFLELHDITTAICLKGVLGNYLVNDFNFSRGVITKKGENLSVEKIFEEFCLDMDSFKLSDLILFARELGMSSIHGAYMEGIYKNFIRVNNEDFVKKDKVIFNSEDVDVIIEKFCPSTYIPISNIDRYSLFPSVGLPWNIFLLESFIRNYSYKFKVMSSSFSMNKCIGAIVRKNAYFTIYDELLADALSNEKALNLNNKDDVIQFLYDFGYIGSKRFKNLEEVIAIARRKQQEKAM